MKNGSLKSYVKILSGAVLLSAVFLLGCARTGEKAGNAPAAQLSDSGTQDHAAPETANYGVMTGSTAEIFIGKTYPDARISTYASIADAFLALDSGKTDYVLTAYTTALNAVRSNDALEICQMDVIEEESSIAVSKDNPRLLADIDRVLGQFKEDASLILMAPTHGGLCRGGYHPPV